MNSMPQTSSKDTLFIGHYAVAFIDLLSQKDRLSKMRELPRNRNELREFIANVKESAGVVDMFRKAMLTSIKTAETLNPNGDMNKDLRFRRVWSEVHKIKIKHKFFSDCFVLWVPLANEDDGIPVAAVLRLMHVMMQIFMIGLAEGYPCRGGIDVGVAAEFFQDELYGPALANAYLLESQFAKYPRIIIGDSLREYISDQHIEDPKSIDQTSIMRRQFAILCKELISEDCDNQAILDYFGLGARRIIGHESAELYLKCVSFCTCQMQRFSDEVNSHLVEKYLKTFLYLRSRKIYWD